MTGQPGIVLTCPKNHWRGTTPNINDGPRTWTYRGKRGPGQNASCTCGYAVKIPGA